MDGYPTTRIPAGTTPREHTRPNSTQNAINANTQPDTAFLPTNDSEVKKLCKDLNNKFNSLVKVELKLTNCNLEFYKNKISSEKFMDNLSQEIKSILFYSHVISGYDRNQLQYYIRHKINLQPLHLDVKLVNVKICTKN